MDRLQQIERARHGDRDAFAALAAGEIGRLYAVAHLIVGASEPARDAVQEAMIRAWQGLPSLRDPDRFDAWLHRLLVRSCYRQRRAERRGAGEARRLPEPIVPDAFGSLANRDEIERGFRRLSAEQRAALVLRFYLDLSIGEVAEALHVPEGTVKSRIHRALGAMRAALEADARPALALTERSA